MTAPGLPLYERFIMKVDASGGPNACHLWTASRNRHGYGYFRPSATWGIYAHRWLLGYLRGSPLGPDELALHHCDNPPCVNPAHLYIGDQRQNIRDCIERGRFNGSGLGLGRLPGHALGKYWTGRELCGTPAGYERHRRQGDYPICAACRQAIAEYQRQRRTARS